ncbi:hypothetical protein PAPYR_10821 [Paratrimastix pyriformis]|uniref:Uncharacterized protein n=1 Tax=Paratrimastix pyriformis TaxID=342808 RepID=A0ABQ8U7R8_9EUKA|nr:hypothetical protein PAPYR_10821 [Paratrimastix pyriformis]
MAEHFDGAIRFLYQRQPVDCDDRFIRQCGDAFNILAYKIEFLKTQIQENAQHISDIKEGSKLFHYITLLHRVTDAIDRMHEHIHVFYNELKDYGDSNIIRLIFGTGFVFNIFNSLHCKMKVTSDIRKPIVFTPHIVDFIDEKPLR